MIYAGDLAIQLPVRDIYDTLIMLASINAARDMYERGLKLIEDFYKNYGDFFSPISSDMDWYNQNVTGKARDFIQNLYSNGVDPLRSAEGRAAIQLFIYSMPVGDINKRKQAAAAAQEYIKARGKLEAEGKWNPEYERYLLGGRSLEDWDTSRDGYWTRTSPSLFKTLQELTEDWYDKRTPHDLTQEEVEGFGMKYDPRYRYQGFTESDLMNIARDRTPGWYGSPYANYYRTVARKKVIDAGLEPTNDNVERQLLRDIATSQQKWLVKPVADEDKFALRAQDHQYDVALENLRHQHIVSRSGNGGGRGHRTNMPSIFDEARQRSEEGFSPGYDVYQDPTYQWITPVIKGAEVIKGANGNYAYKIQAKDVLSIRNSNTGQSAWNDYAKQKILGIPIFGRKENHAIFIQNGRMEARKDENGNYHYFITGHLAKPNGEFFNTGDLYEMEVKENEHSYGKKQSGVTEPYGD